MPPSFDDQTLIEDRLARAAARLKALSQQAADLITEMTQARRELVAAVKAAGIEWPEPAPVQGPTAIWGEVNRCIQVEEGPEGKELP